MAVTHKQRLDLIEEFIRKQKYADLHTLAEEFNISLSTVRRGLNELESKGVLRRHHGGASLVEEETGPGGYDFITQDDRQADEKHAIGQAIADMVESGMTIILDGGTTCYHVARRLIGKRLVVITNSLPVAALFGEVGSMETMVTGGTVYSRLGVLYGPTCEQAISQVHADLAIMGCAGVTPEGIWNTNTFLVSYQKQMLKAADRTIFAFDHTKFDKRALNLTTDLHQGLTVVSDRPPSNELAASLQTAGVHLQVAEPHVGRRRTRG